MGETSVSSSVSSISSREGNKYFKYCPLPTEGLSQNQALMATFKMLLSIAGLQSSRVTNLQFCYSVESKDAIITCLQWEGKAMNA